MWWFLPFVQSVTELLARHLCPCSQTIAQKIAQYMRQALIHFKDSLWTKSGKMLRVSLVLRSAVHAWSKPAWYSVSQAHVGASLSRQAAWWEFPLGPSLLHSPPCAWLDQGTERNQSSVTHLIVLVENPRACLEFAHITPNMPVELSKYIGAVGLRSVRRVRVLCVWCVKQVH